MVIMTDTRTPTDKRIDDLRVDVNHGFGRTDKRFDDLRTDTRAGFDRVDKRVDDVVLEMRAGFARVDADAREVRAAIGSMQKLMIVFFASTLGSVIAAAVAVMLHS